MSFQKSAQDEVLWIARSIEMYTPIFQEDFPKDPKALEKLLSWRKKVEVMIASADARWIELCNGDVSELTEWASRMRSIRVRLDEVDRHIAVKNTRLFSWMAVGECMAFFEAHRIGFQQTIQLHEPPLVEQSTET